MSKDTTEQGPLPLEIIRLGLEGSNFLIPDGQVSSVYGIDGDGNQRIVISVNDIEIKHIDPVTKMVQYNIVGQRQLTQFWDTGGSYLSPVLFDPDDVMRKE